jgi:D-xylose transport system substrate-binding protein
LQPSEVVAAAAANVAVGFLSGESPKAETTLFDTPSQLFKPAVITAENLKAEVVDKGFESAKNLCTGRYIEGCKRLGITN